MKQPCYQLNIDTSSAFTPEYIKYLNEFNYKEQDFETTGGYFYTPIDDASVFNQAWVDQMNSIGLPFVGASAFVKDETDPAFVHVDCSTDPDKMPAVAFNTIITSPNDSCMVWFNWPKEEPIKKYTRPTCWYWPEHVKFQEMYRNSLSQTNLTAVRINIPHTVYTDTKRISISFRVSVDYFKSWEDVKTRLSSYII